MHGRGRDEARDQAIGESRNYIRLERKRRNPATNGGKHGRAGGIPADSNDHIGSEVGDHSSRDPKRVRQVKHGFARVMRLTFLSAPTLNEFERESGLGDQPRLNAARSADEKHFGGELLFELLGDGEGGDHVSAGASARDNDAHGQRRIYHGSGRVTGVRSRGGRMVGEQNIYWNTTMYVHALYR